MATKAPTKRKAPAPAQDSTAFGPIAERFRRAGDHERAISLCREGLKKFPNHASARVTLGWALLETGKYDEAREELEAVLRRAPDNLAAIRGLAELHDRAEHTLNLPMDGPGQWPPALEESADVEPAPAAKSAKAAVPDAAKNAPAVIAPAELGLAMWSPVDAESAEEPVDADGPVAASADVEPALPVQFAHEPAQEPAQPAVYVQTSHPPVAADPVPATQSSHSGMSSMRELDPNAGVVQIQPTPTASTASFAPTSEPSQDLEVDLAALIAEAEKLDAVAEASDDIPTAIELDSQIDLSEFAVDGLAPEPFEVGSGVAHAAAEPVNATAEPFVGEPVVETSAVAAEEPAAASAEPFEVFTAEPAVDLAPEPMVELAPEPVVALAPEPVVELAPEPVVELAPEPVVELAPEPVAELAPEPVVELAVDPAPEPVMEPVAAFEAAAPALPLPVKQPQIVALERFLKQVQTRRLVMVAESVA